jgi:hypothetical protein
VDATTDLGRLTSFVGAVSSSGTVHLVRRLTPTAASHTYKIRGWSSSGTAVVHAGAGGAGTVMPGFIRVVQRGG